MIARAVLKGDFPVSYLLQEDSWSSLELPYIRHSTSSSSNEDTTENQHEAEKYFNFNAGALLTTGENCNILWSDNLKEEELKSLSVVAKISNTRAVEEFLEFIYDEIDDFLSKCITQSGSRSNTPVSSLRRTPPVFCGQKTSSNQNKSEPSRKSNESTQLHESHKKPRRVKLFPSHSEKSPCSNIKSSGSFQSEFKPLGSSTPTTRKNDITLADFLTPERGKSKKNFRNSNSSGHNDSALDNKTSKTLNADHVVKFKSSRSDVKPSRRITPTSVSQSSWHNVRQQAVFTSQSPKKSSPAPQPGSFEEERQRLKEKKAQFMRPITEDFAGPVSAKTPSKSTWNQLVNEHMVQPDPSKVTCLMELERAAKTFSALIEAGQTKDMTMDLYLLVLLVCCQMAEECNSKRSNGVIHSAHDAVMFGVTTLSNCQLLQKLFDPGISRLLSENDRVKLYNPHFAQILSNRAKNETKTTNLNQSTFGSVSFQADTDNSKNFPCDRNFLVFKKQRDIFYEIKREWDSNHMDSTWSFTLSCSEKIFQLLNNSGVDVSNYVHLARLFLNQLIISCIGGIDSPWSDADDDSISLLAQLKQTNPEKYRKLRERFVTPNTSSSRINSQNKFVGQEIFFKCFIDKLAILNCAQYQYEKLKSLQPQKNLEFIAWLLGASIAKDVTFTQHLRDTLSLKLADLNQLDFDIPLPGDNSEADGTDTFTECILTARLVAKFLGYLNFFPYICAENFNPAIDEQYRQLRTVSKPPLDVQAFLETGITQSRLCVVIPWMVQYLSQLDSFSMTLPYYRDSLNQLKAIYERLKRRFKDVSATNSHVLQYVNLSWLFSLSKFNDLESSLSISSPPSSSDCARLKLFEDSSSDESQIVDIKLIYSCSDCLSCTKSLLIEFVMGMHSRKYTTRKITPLTAEIDVESKSSSSSSSLPLQDPFSGNTQQILEDSFFHNQPASLKRTIVFVAERVSSSYIKEFRSDKLSHALLDGKKHIYREVQKLCDTANVKEKLCSDVEKYACKLITHLHETALLGIEAYFSSRTSELFRLLLPTDTDKYVIGICTVVALREGTKKLKNWLKANLSAQYIVSEFNHEIDKNIRGNGSVTDNDSKAVGGFAMLGFPHNNDAPSPTDTLLVLQNVTGLYLIDSKQISYKQIEEAIKQTVECVTGRCDLVVIAFRSILWLLVTLTTALASNSPSLVTPEFISLFDKLWDHEDLVKELNSLCSMIPGEADCFNFQEKLLSLLLEQVH